VELAEADPNLYLVTGDLGFGVVDAFAKRFPRQFVNAGVAEQNMTGLAAGLALSGKTVFTYSIANFTTLRCLEQIRNDVCYHRADVKVVSVGGGFSYGALGVTHHATEDLAIMRALPEMTVVAPGDPAEARLATRAVHQHRGPCFLRLGRAGEPDVHAQPPEFRLGRAILVRPGSDLTLISTGAMLLTATRVAASLEQSGTSARVLSMHTVSPLDEAAVHSAATETRAVFTLEEHSTVGGLGGAVAEVMAEMERPVARLVRIGVPPGFTSIAGDQDFMRRLHGLDEESVLARVRQAL
jgi:transketolase